jgi:hypothetical protein
VLATDTDNDDGDDNGDNNKHIHLLKVKILHHQSRLSQYHVA